MDQVVAEIARCAFADADQIEREINSSEWSRYQLKEGSELDRFLQDIEDGRDEMVRFASAAAHVLTKLAVRASDIRTLAEELNMATAYQDQGFLALAHLLDANPADFFEHLAAFRRQRMAKEAEAKATAGISSPP